MANTTPTTVKVKLLKAHTHAGKSYAKDAEIEVDAAAADWLVAKKVAEKSGTGTTATVKA